MKEEVNNIRGLEIYAPNGLFVGYAGEVVVDTDDRRVVGIIVAEPSPVFVDENVAVQIPFRWIQAIGDVILLKVFPAHINSDGSLTDN